MFNLLHTLKHKCDGGKCVCITQHQSSIVHSLKPSWRNKWPTLLISAEQTILKTNYQTADTKSNTKNILYTTRGPRGPWVAHLRKRSKVTVEPIIENLRGITWTTLVKELLIMLYIKYESNGPCSFRQEDFWKFHFKNQFIDPVTYLCNQLEQFEQLW